MRTREQDTQYRRQLRARKRGEAAAGSDATIIRMPERPGDVQTAVQAELDGLASTAEHSGAAAAALAMAKILDNQADTIHHAAAARALGEILTRLHRAHTGRAGGKLMAMRQARRESDSDK